ncbi:uncharacterized protein LOC130901921 [Diorhabda carinulata]|uniref:uncharacterized protein LOC130448344 n=1 Tax=Diorhabda sublineata TaxID=1163346 RepID=UPI0024E139BF|nr:uncharacterized protein LOC130448344 [Diorhabda sublineata]XP_057669600.1 uncharacterized protein LOC130901921 [Diorhabda carinulata]
MTDLLLPRGDTFPRSFLDTYRATKNDQIYNELTSSKSDELVLQNSMSIPVSEEIHHGRSENLLDAGSGSTQSTEYLDKKELVPLQKAHKRIPVYDRVDPEDSIRDIVTENDFYRFVLFKKHYDKYLHLSQKYEEARNIAYYLEEKYHEVKTERDDLIKQRDQLTKRLESNESLLREKEDEVFLQFERVVYLEEQCDKIRAEKEKCEEQKEIIEKERDKALKILQEQAKESEYNRRKLERARQEVVTHMTRIKNEKDSLERENDQLKEALEAERKGVGKFLIQGRHSNDDLCCMEKQVEDFKLMEHSNGALASQFQKAVQHLATCRLKKCSVCAYTKSTYRKMSPNHRKYDRKLFGCLQTPFLEMRNMIKPPPSPIHSEGESLSEWFCHVDGPIQSDCSSLTVPFAELSISYMDDVSDTSSYVRDKDDETARGNCGSFRRFGSDSGFSSDICADYKSNTTTPKENKFCHNSTLNESDCAKLTRTKWTASFRKLIRRIKK